MLHAEDCSRLHSRLVIQSPDTDVAVLAVHVVTSLACDELWMKTGVRDKLRCIPIHTIDEWAVQARKEGGPREFQRECN